MGKRAAGKILTGVKRRQMTKFGLEPNDGAGPGDVGDCVREISAVNSDLAKADKEFDKDFAQMQDEMEKVKEAQRLVEISATSSSR